jgi:hypothetical protein
MLSGGTWSSPGFGAEGDVGSEPAWREPWQEKARSGPAVLTKVRRWPSKRSAPGTRGWPRRWVVALWMGLSVFTTGPTSVRRLLRCWSADDRRRLQQVFEASEVGGGLPLEQPRHQRLQGSQPTEQVDLDHLGEAAAWRAGRLDQPRSSQLLLPIVGMPVEQAAGLDPVDAGVGAEAQSQQPSVSWVVTPTWAGPGRDGCIWRTPARQLGSLPLRSRPHRPRPGRRAD